MKQAKNIIQIAITFVTSMWFAIAVAQMSACIECPGSMAEILGLLVILIGTFIIVVMFWLWLFDCIKVRDNETEAHDDHSRTQGL